MASVLSLLFGNRKVRRAAARAHQGLLTAALQPQAYLNHAVPDTLEGRAAMVTLHLSLLSERLARIGSAAAARLNSALGEAVIEGFDAALRETGVGDASIARKVRKMAETHTGLGRAVTAALRAPGEAELEAVLVRNGLCAPDKAGAFAAALRAVQASLAEQPDGALLCGTVHWPELA